MKTANLIDTILDNLSSTLHQVDSDQIEAVQKALLRANRIFIAGRGRTGLQMRAFAMRLMHLGLHVYVVDDVTTPGIAAADYLLIGSGSGRTPSLIRYAETARALGRRGRRLRWRSGLANCHLSQSDRLHPRHQFQVRWLFQREIRAGDGRAFRTYAGSDLVI